MLIRLQSSSAGCVHRVIILHCHTHCALQPLEGFSNSNLWSLLGHRLSRVDGWVHIKLVCQLGSCYFKFLLSPLRPGNVHCSQSIDVSAHLHGFPARSCAHVQCPTSIILPVISNPHLNCTILSRYVCMYVTSTLTYIASIHNIVMSL